QFPVVMLGRRFARPSGTPCPESGARRNSVFSFCPNCGQTLDGQQAAGQTLVCRHCGKVIDAMAAPAPAAVGDRTETLPRSGAAARCPQCRQVVEVRAAGTLVPHFPAGQRKACPGSGKPATAPPPATTPAPIPRPPGVKDFSAVMNRD